MNVGGHNSNYFRRNETGDSVEMQYLVSRELASAALNPGIKRLSGKH